MLTVTGLDRNDDVRLIKKYAYFCLSKFVPNKILRKAIISVKFVHHDDFEDSKERKELKECSAWMIYDGVVNDRRKFSITMDKAVIRKNAKKQMTRYKETLKNLGHEMVHVKQYLLNELFDYKDGQTSRYMGGRYAYTGEMDWTYWDAPYEVEAYGRMEGLYQMFLQKIKEEKRA